MRKVKERIYRIQKLGYTHYIAIPPEFLRENDLVKGDEVRVKYDGGVRIIVEEKSGEK